MDKQEQNGRLFKMAMDLVPWETVRLLQEGDSLNDIARAVMKMCDDWKTPQRARVADCLFGVFGKEELLTQADTARFLGVSQARIYQVIKDLTVELEVNLQDEAREGRRKKRTLMGAFDSSVPAIPCKQMQPPRPGKRRR